VSFNDLFLVVGDALQIPRFLGLLLQVAVVGQPFNGCLLAEAADAAQQFLQEFVVQYLGIFGH
jgi:hypothetical protein